MPHKRQYRLSPEGRRRLSEAARRTALKHQPWRFSTGPRTDAGKDRSKGNAVYLGRYLRDPTAVHSPDMATVQLYRLIFAYDLRRSDNLLRRIQLWADRVVELGDPTGLGAEIRESIRTYQSGRRS